MPQPLNSGAGGLQTNRARLKQMLQQLERLETSANRASPIPVVRVRSCIHPNCGRTLPTGLPPDCLIIHLGCQVRPDGRTEDTDEHPHE